MGISPIVGNFVIHICLAFGGCTLLIWGGCSDHRVERTGVHQWHPSFVRQFHSRRKIDEDFKNSWELGTNTTNAQLRIYSNGLFRFSRGHRAQDLWWGRGSGKSLTGVLYKDCPVMAISDLPMSLSTWVQNMLMLTIEHVSKPFGGKHSTWGIGRLRNHGIASQPPLDPQEIPQSKPEIEGVNDLQINKSKFLARSHLAPSCRICRAPHQNVLEKRDLESKSIVVKKNKVTVNPLFHQMGHPLHQERGWWRVGRAPEGSNFILLIVTSNVREQSGKYTFIHLFSLIESNKGLLLTYWDPWLSCWPSFS